ncbi:MAG: metal ABC transporter substrate-binding protein, partial [Planctomycetota bacterium]
MLRLTLILTLLTLLACGGGGDADRSDAHADRSGPPVVVVTFHPTEYLVTRLAGDLVRVVCDVPPDADALFWEPDRRAVQRMQRADLIVLNGAGLERWTERVSLPRSRVLDSSRALA